jgi:hypothetical protein
VTGADFLGADLPAVGWRSKADRAEIPDCRLRDDEESRVDRWTSGERVSREAPAGLDELAVPDAFAARGLTSG